MHLRRPSIEIDVVKHLRFGYVVASSIHLLYEMRSDSSARFSGFPLHAAGFTCMVVRSLPSPYHSASWEATVSATSFHSPCPERENLAVKSRCGEQRSCDDVFTFQMKASFPRNTHRSFHLKTTCMQRMYETRCGPCHAAAHATCMQPCCSARWRYFPGTQVAHLAHVVGASVCPSPA